MTTLGVIFIVIGILLFLFLPYLKKLSSNMDSGVQTKSTIIHRFAGLLSGMTQKGISIITTFGVILVLVPYLFFWAEPGYQYFVVYPTGTKSAVMTEGIKWRGFAKIIPWQKYIDVKVVDDDEDVKEIEGAMKLIPIRFIDQVTAKTKLSTRFQLPTDEQSFIDLAIEFRSLQNLVQTTLIPTVREVVSNTKLTKNLPK